MTRSLLLLAAFAACAGGSEDPPAPGGDTRGARGDERPPPPVEPEPSRLPPPGCAEAQARADECLAASSDATVCGLLVKHAAWACNDVDDCGALSAAETACWARVRPGCAALEGAYEACSTVTQTLCAPFETGDREYLLAHPIELEQCNTAATWCAEVFNLIAHCQGECLTAGMDASDACWIEGR